MQTAVMTNTEILKTAFGYFTEGNVPAILDLCTDDVKWTVPGPVDILPYARMYKGKQQVGEFFRLLNENKEFLAFEPKEYIAEGDKVVAIGSWNAKARRTGHPYTGDWIMVFTFREGKVCEHREQYDTYSEALNYKS